MFSAERRGVLRKQYPDHGFGDISRLVGTEVGYEGCFGDIGV